MTDPDGVRQRWLALQDPAMLAALRAECEASIVEEREVAFSWWAYHPRPFPREMAGEDPSRGGSPNDARLGLDAKGRVVSQHLRDDLYLLYAWTDDYCDVVQFHGALRQLERLVFADGRLVEEIEVDGGVRLDGVLAIDVTRWSYEDGRPVAAFRTYESMAHKSWGGPERGPYWKAHAYTFSYDADGRLAMIMRFQDRREIADGGDLKQAQAAARAGFPDSFDARPFYDARTHRPETELPAPERAFEGLAEPLSQALFAAIDRERGALGPLEFVLVFVGGTRTRAIACDATFVERARRMTRDTRDLLLAAYHAPRGTVRVDVVDAAPADVLDGLRAGEQALATSYGSNRHLEFQRELITALNARSWTGLAPTFVVLSPPVDEHDDYGLRRKRLQRLPELEAVVGRERVDAFLKRVATSPSAEGDARPRSRPELVALLMDAGLTETEAAPVAADAQWGIVLEPGGTGMSRLGGAPVLPAGTPWPHAGERPLTHLATIALSELPAVEGRDQLPQDGLLSFFADLSEEAEFYEPIEPDDDEAVRQLVAVSHTPAGASTYEPAPPGDALDELRVAPVGRLQLRTSGHRVTGLDALAATAVEHLAGRVNGPGAHQLLGHPWAVQEDPREPGQIVLFHTGDDEEFGIGFMDAGDLHFLGTPDDIKHGRWERITVVPNSC